MFCATPCIKKLIIVCIDLGIIYSSVCILPELIFMRDNKENVSLKTGIST